jgi:hypothetical protein
LRVLVTVVPADTEPGVEEQPKPEMNTTAAANIVAAGEYPRIDQAPMTRRNSADARPNFRHRA